MGDIAAQASIDRVLRDHEDELVRRAQERVPVELREYVTPVLEGDTYAIRIGWVFRGLPAMNSDQSAYLEGPDIDIDALAADFPCCEVGY